MIDTSAARLKDITNLVCEGEFFMADYEYIGGLSGYRCKAFGEFPGMRVNAIKLPVDAETGIKFDDDIVTFRFGRPVTCEYFKKGLFSIERIECR